MAVVLESVMTDSIIRESRGTRAQSDVLKFTLHSGVKILADQPKCCHTNKGKFSSTQTPFLKFMAPANP